MNHTPDMLSNILIKRTNSSLHVSSLSLLFCKMGPIFPTLRSSHKKGAIVESTWLPWQKGTVLNYRLLDMLEDAQ